MIRSCRWECNIRIDGVQAQVPVWNRGWKGVLPASDVTLTLAYDLVSLGSLTLGIDRMRVDEDCGGQDLLVVPLTLGLGKVNGSGRDPR